MTTATVNELEDVRVRLKAARQKRQQAAERLEGLWRDELPNSLADEPDPASLQRVETAKVRLRALDKQLEALAEEEHRLRRLAQMRESAAADAPPEVAEER